jgi:hypothetical protein
MRGWAWKLAGPALAVSLVLPTVWMLPRGELYTGYELGPGLFVALAIAVIAFATAIRRRFRH